MEKMTYFGSNKLFLKKKGLENLGASVCIPTYTHTCLRFMCAYFMHAYAYTCMHAHSRVPKTKKERFSALKLGLQ